MTHISLISLYTLGSRFGASGLSLLQVIAHAPGRFDSLLTLPYVLPHIIVPRVHCSLNTLFILRAAGTLKVTCFVRPLVRTALPSPSKVKRERERRGKSEGQGQGEEQGQGQGIGGWKGKGSEGSALNFPSWDLCRCLPRAGSRSCHLSPRRRSRLSRMRRRSCSAQFRQRRIPWLELGTAC